MILPSLGSVRCGLKFFGFKLYFELRKCQCYFENFILICFLFFCGNTQLSEMVGEEGGNLPGLKGETKREILLGLHEASSSMEPPEEWDGPAPEQMLRRLASAWGISLQQILK